MQKAPAADPTATSLSPALRRVLYGTAMLTGASIMIVEILGAKMLAPFLGTSHFVWTAQIAVTMVALALGYYLGGRLVDRSPDLRRLYWAILWAGVYLAASVPLTETVANGCLRFSLAAGSLLASAFLFLVPLCLLAMVGPFLIRVFTFQVSGVGGNVGRLSAISTLGSFAGTLLIGYVLIPLLPNSGTMYATAAVLILAALAFLLTHGRADGGSGRNGAALLLAAVSLGLGWVGVKSDHWRGQAAAELFRGNSNFGLLQVLQLTNAPFRYYLNDYLTQNTYDTNSGQSVSMFTYMLHGLAKAYTPRTDHVLCIGVGVGIVPMNFAREGTRVDAVEINPDVVPVARRFFGFEPDKLNLVLTDGRYFVNHARPQQYDAICLDAFLGDSCPSHLMTREAFAAMARILKPDGVLVINTFADLDYANDFFSASLSKTLSAVFPSVRIHAGRRGNTMLVASPRPDLAIVRPPSFEGIHAMARADVEEAFRGLRETDPAHGIVLTDDYNPVEFRDAANREAIRKNLARSMQSW